MPKKDSNPYLGGYGYSNYNQYSYAEHESSSPEGGRTLLDYLVLLRERIWYIAIIFFIVFTSSVLYTFTKPKLYTSHSQIEIQRQADRPMPTTHQDPNLVANELDLNTIMNTARSSELVRRVSDRITGSFEQEFMAPYADARRIGGPLSPAEVLHRNRSISPQRGSRNFVVGYTHHDPEIAQRVANLFSNEFIAMMLERDFQVTEKAVEDLRAEARQKRREVEDLERQLAEYRREFNSISIDRSEDIALTEVGKMKALLVDHEAEFRRHETRWEMIQEFKEEDRPLWELDFISTRPRVADLLSSRTNSQIRISTLSQRYRHAHPAMIEARQNLEQIETELEAAINSAVASTRAAFQENRANVERTRQSLEEKERELIMLAEQRVPYHSIKDQLEVARNAYHRFEAFRAEREAESNWKNPSARVIEPAHLPRDPSSPRVPINLAAGFIGGLGLGLGIAFVLAFFDHRIKSINDLENIVGIPLLGIIPRMSDSLTSSERAKAVATNMDPKVVEAFRSIYSSINLNEQGKGAQVIVCTSTLPSEGKSFCAANLALTYAGQGLKTLIIDSDLRLPTMDRCFNASIDTGLYDHFFNDKAVDEIIVSNVSANLDLLPCEKSPDNPIQVLNSVEFEKLLIDLRHRYHKIIIDTPPVGAVSDTFCLLPLVDALVYVVKFNSVKQKTAKNAVAKLMESGTPVLGGVMNSVSTKMSQYYYSHYYDYSYRDYYVGPAVPERGTSSRQPESRSKIEAPSA